MVTSPPAKRDAYDVLMRKLRYPVSRTLRKILELSCSPEEAQIMVELPGQLGLGYTGPTVISAEEIASKLNRETKMVETQIESLFQKGVLRERVMPDGQRQAVRLDDIDHLNNEQMWVMGARDLDERTRTIRDGKNQEIADLWEKFFLEEYYRWERVDQLVHRRVTEIGGPEGGRTFDIFPCWKAVEKSEQMGSVLLPDWDARQIALRGEEKGIAARVCVCRVRARKCDRPVWTCGAFVIGTPGFSSYTQDRRNLFKKFSGEEWLEMVGQMEEDLGMVHIGRAGSKGCSCCPECCNWLEPLLLYAEPWEGVNPGPYRAVVNEEVCEGCVKNCVPRCHFKVMKGQTNPSSGKVKAFVDIEKCVGCGQCVIGCPVEGAIKLEVATKIDAPVDPLGARRKLPDKLPLPARRNSLPG